MFAGQCTQTISRPREVKQLYLYIVLDTLGIMKSAVLPIKIQEMEIYGKCEPEYVSEYLNG